MESNFKTIRANIAPAILIGALSLLVAVIGLALNAYNSHYSHNVDSSGKATITYSSATNRKGYMDAKPAKGTLYWGWAQTTGTNNNTYVMYIKETSSLTYVAKKGNVQKPFAFGKNNTYYGDYKLFTVNGKTNYNLKFERIDKASNKSVIATEWGLD
jgi:hypothetical protein